MRMHLLVAFVWVASLSSVVAEAEEASATQHAPASAAAGTPGPAETTILPNLLYGRTLRSTCWIVVVLPDGFGSGTGWVLDRGERLLVTNHHLVIDPQNEVVEDENLRVFFPEHDDGRLITEPEHYLENAEALEGEVLDSDGTRDLAIIRLKFLPAQAVELPLALDSPRPGEMVYSIGNPGSAEALWIYTSGTVRQLHQLKVMAPWGDLAFHAVMTQSPTNPGDSGGPVVNAHGQLVGVTESWKTGARLISNCIDVSEVRSYRAEVQPLLHPKSAMDYNQRGVHYYEKGRYDRALTDFTSAIRLDKSITEAYANRGWAFLKKDDPDSALGDFDEAIRLDPGHVGAYGGRAEAHLGQGAFDQAIADATNAIRLDPNNAFSYHRRGAIYYQQGNYDRAIADCNQAIRLDPREDRYYNNRGRAYDGKGEYDRAIADYSLAIEFSPRRAVYYCNRGQAYRHRGDLEQADADYQRMEEIDPEYAQQKKEVFSEKYLKIANANPETLRVHLVYRAQCAGGQRQWRPGPPNGSPHLTFVFEPGESAYVSHDGHRISADRVRIWAESAQGTGSWTEFKGQDLLLVGEDGYEAYYLKTHTFEFTP
jgi:tetratricopeptide (TPR) repeat protein